MIALLAACYTFDDAPLAEGPHCAPDMLAYVVEVLDGDTVRVYAYGNEEQLGGDDGGGDTGELNSSGSDAPSGDDAYVLDVRMLGVDAPEIAHDSTEVADCYGDEAANFSSDLLLDQWVILSFDRTCTDAYGRALAYVILGDVYDDVDECEDTEDDDVCEPDSTDAAVLVNDILIRYGYARVYEEFDDIRLAELLYSAQEAAQASNQGLWAECE
ncbi:MAG: thermonuclease family protein [Deltaproteobacteria bacterium]|nr:thermonuclease family protein [Deltaproteobacteria bacterium]